MFTFTLSKINLLILVVALFSIISLFMFSFGDIVKQNDARQLGSKLANEISTVLTGSTYCDRFIVHLPPFIPSLVRDKLFYELKISNVDTDSDALNGNTLIFALQEQGKPDFIIAANALKTIAFVHLYQRNSIGQFEKASLEDGIVLNPQALPPLDALAVIKRIESSNQNLYLIPCSIPSQFSRAEICGPEISEVAALEGFEDQLSVFQC